MCFGQAITRDVVEATVASLTVARDSVLSRPEAFEFKVDVFVFAAVYVIKDAAGDGGFLYVGVNGGVGFRRGIALNVGLGNNVININRYLANII